MGRSGADSGVTLELLHAVTKVPLPLQGPETTSAVVCTLARELTYSKDEFSQIGTTVTLHHIVSRDASVRSLGPEALDAIHVMAWHYLVWA